MDNMTESHVFTTVTVGGTEVPFITDAVAVSWAVMALIVIITLVFTGRLKNQPGKGQILAEVFVEFVNNMCKNTIGHHWKPFAPYIGTILLYVALSNLAGLFNIVPSGAFLAKYLHIAGAEHFEFPVTPPTKNFNVTLCLTLMTMSIVIFSEFYYKGLRGWLRSFYRPMAFIGVIKIMDYFTRPTSLCLRLLGNILGGFIIIELIYMAFPPAIPAFVGIYFDLFDGILQAYVFAFLTMVYLQEATEAV